MGIDDLLDALYGGPPEAFVATRDRLVRELRDEGRTEDARSLKERRRPTASAAALNALVRGRPDAIAALREVGGRLRTAHVAALREPGGPGAAELRDLEARRRDLVRELLRDVDRYADELEPVLLDAAVDEELGREVAAGRMERLPERAAGFGALEVALGDAPLAPAPRRAGADRREAAAQRREAERAAATARRDAEAELREAKAELRRAERRVEAAERAFEALNDPPPRSRRAR